MEKNCVSLITVCRMRASTLATTLESVAQQVGVEIDYQVIDGASTDGTCALLQEFERTVAHHPTLHFRWLSEPDQGMYDALNKGIRRATGALIGILNADDVLASPHTLENLAHAFDAHTQIVLSDIRFAKGTSLTELRTAPSIRYYSACAWHPWKLRWGCMPPHPGLYARKSCFAQVGLYATDYKIAGDFEWIVRALFQAKLPYKYLPQCSVVMRMGGLSTRSWRSNLLLNHEIVRANRAHGMRCCFLQMLPKYFFKIGQFIFARLKKV